MTWAKRNAGVFLIVALLAILVFRPYFSPDTKAAAEVARFDYVRDFDVPSRIRPTS
jgi:hypothetical protein